MKIRLRRSPRHIHLRHQVRLQECLLQGRLGFLPLLLLLVDHHEEVAEGAVLAHIKRLRLISPLPPTCTAIALVHDLVHVLLHVATVLLVVELAALGGEGRARVAL